MLRSFCRKPWFLILLLLVMAAPSMLLATTLNSMRLPAPGLSITLPGVSISPAICTGGYDSIGDYRVYRMVTNTDNACQVYYTPIPPILDNFPRIAGITLYQATQIIIFEPGFVSEDGASFIAEIVPGTFGVPQATNLTGTADNNLNWIQATAFDENGNVIGDTKNFYDNSGRALQSQAKAFYRATPTTVYTHVLASQSIQDAYGRGAATTLAAPIDYADFSYRLNFAQHNSAGANYNHQQFDLYNSGSGDVDKTSNPDPLWDATTGSGPVQGTLAWYYSTSNSWEPYTSVTNYPYSRQTYYQDGTGNTKKSAGVGDPLKMGAGREGSGYLTPVANELDHYILVRNKFFGVTEVGALPGSLQNQAMQTVSHDANGIETVTIQDRGGKTLMTARIGAGLTVNNTVTVGGPSASDMNIYYFKLLAAGAVGVGGGSYALYDMNNELVPLTSFSSGSMLPVGYYKLINTGSAALTLTYSNSYTDVSYNFYDQKGQLLAAVAPEGTKKLYGTPGLGFYTNRSSAPFISLYGYDVRGRLVSSQDPDGGAHQYIYRNDGKIRFSQNAVQATSGSFSYTNYDPLGRAVESGQYDGSGITFGSAAMTGILESTGPGGGLTMGTKTDVNLTQYDIPDISHGITGYVQDAFNLSGAVSVTRKYSTVVNNAPASTNLVSATWFNYDEEGKLVWSIRYINGLGTDVADRNSYKTTDYTYDVMGHLITRVFQAGQPDAFAHIYDYDPVNKQLWHVSTSVGTASPILQATYSYYLNGMLKRVELAGNLQGIDYTYTLQGALKAINNSNKTQDPGNDGSANGFSVDAFGEVLDYYTGDYTNGRNGAAVITGVNVSSIPGNTIPESYVGNIKAMSWYSKKPASVLMTNPIAEDPTAYVYNYDPKYQFLESTWGTNLSFSGGPATFLPGTINKEKIGNPAGNIPAYDGNGNIQYLQRTYGDGVTSPDQFGYHYDNNNNQLTSVVNTATSLPYASYTYDARGQVTGVNTGDVHQQYIVYDVTGKVTAVYSNVNHTQASQLAGFVYDETGKRIKKTSYSSSGQVNKVTYYVGDVIYTQVVTSGSYGPVTAQEYQINGADRIGVYCPYPQMPVYAYEMKDHLGNVRAVIALNNNALDVRESSDYYPYGMVLGHGGLNEYRYGYQGQNAEKDPETGWNAFELRMYDSKIGRWLQYDPAGQFYSPYMGMGNNPVSGVDKDGGEESPIYDSETGDFLGVDDQGFKGDILFMSKDQYSDLSNNGTKTISHDIAEITSYKIGSYSLGTDMVLPYSQNTATILDAAFTDIVSRMHLPSFKMQDIHNGMVSVYGNYSSYDNNNDLEWHMINANDGLLDMEALLVAPAAYSAAQNTITYNLSLMEYLNTVENVQNIAVHEIEGHKIGGFNASVGKHSFSYLLQMKDPTFPNTTPLFQMGVRLGYQLAIKDDMNFNRNNH